MLLKIKSIKKIKIKSPRYDITVDNVNNYFANNILIHNCNAAFVYIEDRLWARSRNYFKKKEPHSHWWEIPEKFNLEEKLKNYPGLVIWGELYGSIKGWLYDCEKVNGKYQRKFRVFDIWDSNQGKFLEWTEVVKITAEIGLETVPVLYSGPWKTDRSLHYLAEGQSTLGKCVREGIVIRSVPESSFHRLRRKILKLKGRDYKLAKG